MQGKKEATERICEGVRMKNDKSREWMGSEREDDAHFLSNWAEEERMIQRVKKKSSQVI